MSAAIATLLPNPIASTPARHVRFTSFIFRTPLRDGPSDRLESAPCQGNEQRIGPRNALARKMFIGCRLPLGSADQNNGGNQRIHC
jgi:hypothetical protein